MTKCGVVFLDRDGTINIDTGYVSKPEDLHLIPGVAQAIGDIRRAGLAVFVVTNQSAIGRGKATVEDVERTNAEMLKQLTAADPDAKIDRILYCPHRPSDGCNCRKPLTGMFTELPEEMRADVDIQNSFMVGDKCSDLDFGLNLGLVAKHCFLVLTGHGAEEAESIREDLPSPLPSLVEAVERIRALKCPA